MFEVKGLRAQAFRASNLCHCEGHPAVCRLVVSAVRPIPLQVCRYSRTTWPPAIAEVTMLVPVRVVRVLVLVLVVAKVVVVVVVAVVVVSGGGCGW